MPDGETDPFVLNYEINSRDENDAKFRFVISSKLLLKSAIGVQKLHCDATYKLNWNGFPVLIVGTSDMHRKFHIICISICTNETEADFRFIFGALKYGLGEKFDARLKPKYLISDAARSIQNAFRVVFGKNNTIIMCWFHMKKAVKGHMERCIADERTRLAFLVDLDQSQLSKSTKIFG